MNPVTESPIMKNRSLTVILAAITAGAAFSATAPTAEAGGCLKVRINPRNFAVENANRRAQQRTFGSKRSNTSQPDNPAPVTPANTRGPRIVEASHTVTPTTPPAADTGEPVTVDFVVSPLWNEAFSFGICYDPASTDPVDADAEPSSTTSLGLEVRPYYQLMTRGRMSLSPLGGVTFARTANDPSEDDDDNSSHRELSLGYGLRLSLDFSGRNRFELSFTTFNTLLTTPTNHQSVGDEDDAGRTSLTIRPISLGNNLPITIPVYF